jgi:hypothetical protein
MARRGGLNNLEMVLAAFKLEGVRKGGSRACGTANKSEEKAG